MEENKPTRLQWYQFYAKYTVIVVSAVFTLISGTKFLDKQTKELKLKNERLSKNSIPLASHTMGVNVSNSPWIVDNALCTVNGLYSVENIGELPFMVTEVEFSVYEFEVVGLDAVQDKQVTSLTLFNRLRSKEPIFKEVLNVQERVGVKGRMDKSFSYVIRKKNNYNYLFVADARGGLTDTKGNIDSTYLFGVNELTHTIGPSNICP